MGGRGLIDGLNDYIGDKFIDEVGLVGWGSATIAPSPDDAALISTTIGA